MPFFLRGKEKWIYQLVLLQVLVHQIALFVVPILVIAGILLNRPFTLVFTGFEIISVLLAAIIMNLIAHDGKSNWFEGVMQTAVYIIIAIGFFFIP